MAKKQYTEQEIEAILNSFDGVEKVAPSPFLFTRVMARMQDSDDNIWSRILQFITKPAFALGIALVFLMINLYILLNQNSGSVEQADESTQTLALEYTSLTSTIYDNNTETP
ncbi:MAG: hypothetical protein ACRC2O_13185 [Chitinophagaceae bacterium]